MKKNNIFSIVIITVSVLSLASVFVFSGCGKNSSQNDKGKAEQKTNAQTEAKAEELKKPVSQNDVDKELEAIDKDLKSLSADDLKDADLNETSL